MENNLNKNEANFKFEMNTNGKKNVAKRKTVYKNVNGSINHVEGNTTQVMVEIKEIKIFNKMFNERSFKFLPHRVRKGIKQNIKEILSSRINLDKYNEIESIDHLEDINNFVKLGVKSDYETAKFVKSLLAKMINEDNYRKRKEIEKSIQFLKSSTEREKSILVWAYILKNYSLIEEPVKALEFIKTTLRNKFSLNRDRKSKGIEFSCYMLSDEEIEFFNEYTLVSNKRNTILMDGHLAFATLGTDISKKEKIKEIQNLEEFRYSKIQNGNRPEMRNIANSLNNTLSTAAMVLMQSAKII